MDSTMNFEAEIKALGPRPQPRPGGSTWQADHAWFIRYLQLFPKNGLELVRRYRKKEVLDVAA
jgi:hypothetical protein